jgi:hypothetical protein
MNECSQYLPITVLMNTHSKIVRNVGIMYVVLEQFTQHIQIPRQNNITFMILFKHTSKD